MIVIKVDAINRFSKTDLRPRHERFHSSDLPLDDMQTFLPVVYTCAKCQYQVEFSPKNFEKHRQSDFTNLKPEEQLLMNQYLFDQHIPKQSSLDFYCPQCKQPVGVFFSDGYGGKHGDYICTIDFVLEIEDDI